MTSYLLEDRDGEPDFNLMNKLRQTLKRLKDDLLHSCELSSNNIWIPNCLHCSPFTRDVLVGMQQIFNWKPIIRSRVDRYDYTGKIKNKGPVRFLDPVYVAENNNGDIMVSDRSIVLVTDHEGNDRFKLYGLKPNGIRTDALSHILVCATKTNTVHVFDRNGEFLKHLLFIHPALISPCFLAYDTNTYQLWVESDINKRVHVNSYLTRPSGELFCFILFISSIFFV